MLMTNISKQIVYLISRKRGLIPVLIVSLVLICLSIYWFARQNNQLDKVYSSQSKLAKKEQYFQDLFQYIKQVESNVRGYAATGDVGLVNDFENHLDSVKIIFAELVKFEKKNGFSQDSNLNAEFENLVLKKITLDQQVKNLCDEGKRIEAVKLISSKQAVVLSNSVVELYKNKNKIWRDSLQLSTAQFVVKNNRTNIIAYSGIFVALILILVIVIILSKEINRRKKLSVELKEQKELFRTTLNSLGEAVISTDNEGKIQYMNHAAEWLCGWNWKEAKKQPLEKVFNVVNEETNKPIENIVSRILKDGKKIQWENNTLLKANNHKTFIINNNGAPLLDANKKVSGVVLVFNDITEKNKTEKALRENERKYRSLVEQASDVIIVYSIDGNIFEFNNSACILSGYSHEEFSGLTIKDLLVGDLIINPDKYAELLNGKPITITRQFFKKDKTLLDLEFTVSKLDDKRFLAFGRDITERKKAENELIDSRKRFQNLVESISGVYWVTDLDINRTLYISPFYETITGRKSEEIFKNQKTLINLIFPEDRESFFSAYKNISKTLKTDISFRILKTSGEIRWISAKSKVFIENNGHKIEYGYAEDITDNKKAQEEILGMNSQLRLLSDHLQKIREEERTHMAREIHDALGQQLTIMKMDVSWLHEKFAKSDEKVKQRTEELKNILDSTVNTVRRIASDLRPSILDDMGLGAAIEWHLVDFEKRSGVKTEFDNMDTELALPDNVKTGMFRIVQESLTNVIRYANAKNVFVSLKLKAGNIELFIRDNGSGFDNKKIAVKKTFGIMGMKERAKMMGGIYKISSEPGIGTTVHVIIPNENYKRITQ